MRKLKHAQEKLDQLGIDAIGDEFIRGSEHRLRLYCTRILRKWLSWCYLLIVIYSGAGRRMRSTKYE